MNSSGVSCIVTCYNDAEYLHECISSIEASTISSFEIIVVDDGSTIEDTISILKTYQEKGYRIVRKENGGVGSARNLGVSLSKYKNIVAIDVDDKITETYLQQALEIMNNEPSIGIVYGDVRRFGMSDELFQPGPFHDLRLLSGNYISVSAVFKKEVWEQSGGYDESLPNYEDWDFWLKCMAKGVKFHYMNEVGLLYRKRTNSKVDRCANPEHREKVVQKIVSSNHSLYSEQYPQVIASLHKVISSMEHTYQERLQKINHSNGDTLIKKIERLETENEEMKRYYEGSIFWKIKLIVNRFFKRRKK